MMHAATHVRAYVLRCRQWQQELDDAAAGGLQVWQYEGGRPTTIDHIVARRLNIKSDAPKATAAKRAAVRAAKATQAAGGTGPTTAAGESDRAAHEAAAKVAPGKRPLAAAVAAEEEESEEDEEEEEGAAAAGGQVPTYAAWARTHAPMTYSL